VWDVPDFYHPQIVWSAATGRRFGIQTVAGYGGLPPGNSTARLSRELDDNGSMLPVRGQ